MKILLAIIVYDRYANLVHWLKCLQKCNTENIDVVMIHNVGPGNSSLDFFELCFENNARYFLRRQNIGYDIGALQDVCAGRLNNFPEWDKLLWVTDDVFPMSTDFIQKFNKAMMPDVGIACMEISPHVKKHIRTSAFMIDKTVAERLTFPADPITTKRQCYEFEHMGKNAFYEQIIKMGLKVVQVAPNKNSPLWDSGYRRKLDRQKEHEEIFGAMPVQPPFISKAEHLKNESIAQ